MKKMKKEKPPTPRCTNEGCGRPAPPEDRFCDACGIEWALFHRETRFEKRIERR